MSKSIKITVKLLITVAILVIIFYRIPINNVIEIIKTCEPTYFALAVFMQYLQRIVMGYRTRILAIHQGMDVNPSKFVSIGLIATFYGVFLPGTLAGGAVRWYKLNKITAMPSQTLVMILFDRMIDTVFMASLGLIFFILDDSYNGNQNLMTDMVTAVLILVGIYLIAFNRKATNLGVSLILAIPFTPLAIKQKISKVVDVAANYSKMPAVQHIQIFALSVVIYLIGVSAFVFLAKGLQLELGFYSLAWITSLVTAIVMLPISFSGLGVREAGLIVVLEPYGVSAASALAFSLLMFSSTLVLSAGGGLLELYDQYFSRKKNR